ncbi:MAG TPA: hypothetical protein VMH37_05685 [Candidatus Binataceae bacterium]|nr:hypothetical protein [Candidatus Binataceae bacterium]
MASENSAKPPFEVRRDALIGRVVTLFSSDPRYPAGWLEGSLADGSADPYSDIDLYLLVADNAWDEVWNNRRAVVEEIAPILAATEIMGIFGIACLLEGPVKFDLFFERGNTVGHRKRIAVKRLWGPDEVFRQLKLGDNLGENEIARALQYNVLGFLQGATWPVRLLARGQVDTLYYTELLLVETGLVPLMLLERDRRTFHRNPFTRAKMLTESEHREYTGLIDKIKRAFQDNDRVAMRDVHIEIHREICRRARIAFAQYKLEFPPRVEDEMLAFYQREWPME